MLEALVHHCLSGDGAERFPHVYFADNEIWTFPVRFDDIAHAMNDNFTSSWTRDSELPKSEETRGLASRDHNASPTATGRMLPETGAGEVSGDLNRCSSRKQDAQDMADCSWKRRRKDGFTCIDGVLHSQARRPPARCPPEKRLERRTNVEFRRQL